MNSGGPIDVKALNWVKGEIGETLEQVRQALEVHVTTPDPAKLDFIVTHLHQIAGTLNIVELFGAAMLAEEMEHLAVALKNDQVKQLNDAYEVLTRGILQLPAYLEHLRHGNKDQPVILLPLLNDLRVAHGQQLLSENAMFSPDLGIYPSQKAAAAGDARTPAKKLRTVYQAALVGLIRGNDAPAQLKKLSFVLAQLDNACSSDTARQLWWAAQGVIEALIDRGLEASLSVKSLLGHIDRQLKKIVDHGETALSSAPPRELVKNLLFYVARSTSRGARVKELKRAFKLNELLPNDSELSQAQNQLLGMNAGVMDNVAAALKDDLLSIKDTIDLFVRSLDHPLSELEPVVAKLRTVADTLGILGLGKLRNAIKEQQAIVQTVLNGTEVLHDEIVMGIASALLYVESSLSDLNNVNTQRDVDDTAAPSDSMLPETEFRSLVTLTVQEAKTVMARVKDIVMQFAAQPNEFESLQSVPELLNDIKGAVSMLGYDHAAELLQRAGDFLSNDVLSTRSEIATDKLDTFADVITGIEYFLESVEDDSTSARNSLSLVRDRLARLGYVVDAPAEETTVEATPQKLEIARDVAPRRADIAVQEIELPTLEPVAEVTSTDVVPTRRDTVPANITPDPAVVATTKPEPEEQPEIDAEVMEIFLEEAGEESHNINTNLAAWQKDLSNDEPLRTLRRSFHTIKGSGRIVGAMELGEFAWSVENMLNRVIDRTIDASPTIMNILEQAKEMLPHLIECLRTRQKPGIDTQPTVDLAHRVAKGETVDQAAPVPETAESDEDRIIGADAPAPTTSTKRNVDPVLAEIFVNETRTHINAIMAYIDRCSPSEVHCTVTDDLIRALHTLHGSAHMANIDEIAETSDALEKLAKLLTENHSIVREDVLSLLRDAISFYNDVLLDLNNTQPLHAAKASLLERIAALHHVAAQEQNQRLQSPADSTAPTLAEEPMPEDVDAELVNVFMLEASDVIRNGLSLVSAWASIPNEQEYADEIRRRLSTLQGGARISNLKTVAQVCGITSSVLATAIGTPGLLTGDLVRLTRNALEWLALSLDEIREHRVPQAPADLLAQLESYSTAMSILAAPAETVNPDTAPEAIAETEADNEVKDIFFDEAVEILAAMEDILPRWSAALDDAAIVAELQRALHTLKGGARMAKISPVGDLSHHVETLLQRIGDGAVASGAAAFDLVQVAHDWIAHGVEQLRGGAALTPATDIIAQIDDLMAGRGAPASVEPEENEITPAPAPTSQVIPFRKPAETTPPESEVAVEYDDDLVEVFLEEGAEILHTVDELVAQWAKDTGNKEVVANLQRALHTLKGGARMAKVTPVGDLSHSIESILEGIDQGRVAANPQLIDLMHTANDWLTVALDRVRDKSMLASPASLIEDIEAAVGLRAPRTATAAPRETVSAPKESAAISAFMGKSKPTTARVEDEVETEAEVESAGMPAKSKATGEQVRVALALLDNLVNNAGEVSIYRSRIELQLNSVKFNLVELAQTVNRLREQLRKFEIEAEAQILFRYEKTGETDQEEFDPLELDRFSNMQQLSRSLVESVGDLASIQKLLDNLTRESEILLVQQSRVGTALQDGLTRTRLVPFSSVVPRLRRIVRQTAKELSKHVELKVVGAEGEMDRSVLNRLTPALEHMLRNAVDHGIESPEKRLQAGKPKGGTITLRFWREGPEILLSIADDGLGMNLDAIRKKAIERGLMTAESDLGESEIIQFVLEAGFSTAHKVTQISGRGVGMDVVNNEIKQLNGTLQIGTDPGKGTTFIVRLPLTVSVNQALIVHAGEQTYAIPLATIDGVVRISGDDLQQLHEDEHLRYEYGGHNYKFFHLGTLLNVSRPTLPEPGTKLPLILARAGDHRVALQAEAIVARQEVVIKSVGPQVSTVAGISGATILSDGGVALILDIASLIRAGIAHATAARTEQELPAVARVSTIMIVDDSITVRKVTDRFLKRHNFETMAAKDGVDALTQLQEHIPDLMLLDIEMPRMDGYELATAMRNDERLKNIPIIMITSRTGDKHRERAMTIGVNAYMGKPYQENELLENIEKLLNARG